MYTTKRYEAKISVPEYLERFVDVPTFLEACRACPNYDQIWSCPSYDFDVMEYWNRYQTLYLLAEKIIFDESLTAQSYTAQEQQRLVDQVIPVEKQKLGREMMEKEKEIPGSISLSAGSCTLCNGNCTKPDGKPCRFPDQMRYSIESLGGNVGLTIEKLMGIRLKWMEEGRLPEYFVLVNGLLVPELI